MKGEEMISRAMLLRRVAEYGGWVKGADGTLAADPMAFLFSTRKTLNEIADLIAALPVVSSPVTLTREKLDELRYRVAVSHESPEGMNPWDAMGALIDAILSARPTLRECPTNHGRVEMLAHEDDFPPNGPCLMWSPICRDCGADVPMAAQ
jgi:hypothetical protein